MLRRVCWAAFLHASYTRWKSDVLTNFLLHHFKKKTNPCVPRSHVVHKPFSSRSLTPIGTVLPEVRPGVLGGKGRRRRNNVANWRLSVFRVRAKAKLPVLTLEVDPNETMPLSTACLLHSFPILPRARQARLPE